MEKDGNAVEQLASLQRAVREARNMVSLTHAKLQSNSRRLGKTQAVPTTKAFQHFSKLLQGHSLRDALAYLVGLSDYRFISIFRFQEGKATSVVHYDKLDPQVMQADEVPDTATYCKFVRDRDSAFMTLDAAQDDRTVGHVAREVVASYCGLPILTPEGGFIGTLCHYDLVPNDPGQLDLELLLQVGSTLAQSGKIPAYPSEVALRLL